MGTNYYAHQKHSASVQTPDSGLHICKSMNNFQGHEKSPYGVISSWKDWKTVLQSGDLVIVDEYGDVHDPALFIFDVESVPLESRRRQYDWMQNEWKSTHAGQIFPEWGDEYWLDDDQFTFSFRYFS